MPDPDVDASSSAATGDASPAAVATTATTGCTLTGVQVRPVLEACACQAQTGWDGCSPQCLQWSRLSYENIPTS